MHTYTVQCISMWSLWIAYVLIYDQRIRWKWLYSSNSSFLFDFINIIKILPGMKTLKMESLKMTRISNYWPNSPSRMLGLAFKYKFHSDIVVVACKFCPYVRKRDCRLLRQQLPCEFKTSRKITSQEDNGLSGSLRLFQYVLELLPELHQSFRSKTLKDIFLSVQCMMDFSSWHES